MFFEKWCPLMCSDKVPQRDEQELCSNKTGTQVERGTTLGPLCVPLTQSEIRIQGEREKLREAETKTYMSDKEIGR